jgi:uncharacterized Rossmann fold enzyme
MQGRSFVRNGKTLLSGIDPIPRAERIVNSISVKDRTLYFCPSPLYGYGLAVFLSRLEKEAPNSAVLCVEADGELYELTEKNTDPSLADSGRLRITNICDAANLCALVREAWGARTFRRVETLRLTGGWQLFPEIYDSLCESLRQEIATDWSNALTLAKMGRLYIRNTLRNLSLVLEYPSIEKLSFGAAPILVLGAGPSLDETLDALKTRYANILADTENRPFKIICVDTCLRALKDRNIVPDMAVILESQHWNIHDFLGCRGWNVKSTADLSSLPACTRLLSGAGFLFLTPWTQLKIFERLKKSGLLPAAIAPLGSVGLTAVELARRLTSGKIICSGIDFSFTPDKYHARSAPGHHTVLNLQNRLRRLFNIAVYNQYSTAAVSKSGFSVYTNPAMKNYRNLFEREFGGNSRIFDIEGSGLPLGLKTLSVNDAMMSLDEDKFIYEPHLPDNLQADRQTNVNTKDMSNEEFQKTHNKKSELNLFFENEKKRLEELKNILTGEAAADTERLNVLIDECDYLWAHFPDFAGGDRRPELSDISFLKRIRVETEPMLKLLLTRIRG